MITETLKELSDFLEEHHPLSFRACYPRNIAVPGGYANPRHYASMMIGHFLTVLNESTRHLPHATGFMNSMLLAAHKVPTYFVSYEFCQAVANTELPSDFLFSELKWPLASQLFVLPDQFVHSHFGVYAPFISVSRVPIGKFPDCLPKMPPTDIQICQIETTQEKILFDYPVFYPNRLPTDFNGNYPLTESLESMKNAPWVDTTAFEHEVTGIYYNFNEEEMTPEQESVYIQKALRFAVKLLLCVAARPAAVEHGQMARKAKIKHGRERKELWEANMIGRAYRIPRERRNWQPGTSASRRAFRFRRGHYTWQAKRFKHVEFIPVESMPQLQDGGIDFKAAGEALTAKFHTVHERMWIEGILREDEV